MSVTTEKPVLLATLADGKIEEMFKDEFDRVIRNIRDEKTEAGAKRSITLKIDFFPDDERYSLRVVASSAAKLAPIQGAVTAVFLGYEGQQLVAVESNPRQLGLALPSHQPTQAPAPPAGEKG